MKCLKRKVREKYIDESKKCTLVKSHISIGIGGFSKIKRKKVLVLVVLKIAKKPYYYF